MKITFHGAARTVTGSKHLVHINPDKKILLDCGMFQGLGKETIELNSHWGFEPRELNYVIISHAHIDHVGLLPKLVADGYAGKVYCTPQTAELAKILLLDSAHIQESDIEHVNRIREKQDRPLEKPLYTIDDVEKACERFVTVPYDEHYHIDDDVELMYTDCGHILGSAAINLVLREHGKEVRLTFSGDIGRYNDVLLRKPQVFPQADYIIIESTYGNKFHEPAFSTPDKILKHVVHTCLKKKGKLIIPSFSVGRTQELLYYLNRLETENRLPPINYYVDSLLSIAATEIIKNHPECFNKDVQDLLTRDEDVFAFKGLHYVKTAEESMQLTASHEPCVIISASGMAEAGRVKHHIAGGVDDHRNTILIVGYCEPHSLGARLKSGMKQVKIYGEEYEVRADVESMETMSAHGDFDDLSQWLACQEPKDVRKLFLVHGEYEEQLGFRDRLAKKGFTDIEIPSLHQEIGLGDLD